MEIPRKENGKAYPEIALKHAHPFLQAFVGHADLCREQGYEPIIFQNPEFLGEHILKGYLWAPEPEGDGGDWVDVSVEFRMDPERSHGLQEFLHIEIPLMATDERLLEFDDELEFFWYNALDERRKKGARDLDWRMVSDVTRDNDFKLVRLSVYEETEETVHLLLDDCWGLHDFDLSLHDGLSLDEYAARVGTRLSALAGHARLFVPGFIEKTIPEIPRMFAERKRNLSKKRPDWTQGVLQKYGAKNLTHEWQQPERLVDPDVCLVGGDVSIHGQVYSVAIESTVSADSGGVDALQCAFVLPELVADGFGRTQAENEVRQKLFSEVITNDQRYLRILSRLGTALQFAIHSEVDESTQGVNLTAVVIELQQDNIHELLQMGVSRENILSGVIDIMRDLHPLLVEFAQY